METKTCIKCGVELPKTSEYFQSRKDSLRGECRACQAKYNKEYRNKHKNTLNENHKQYVINNRQRISHYQKQWRELNGQRVIECRKRHSIDDKDRIAERAREWRKNNKEALADKKHQYAMANRDQARIRGQRYEAAKRKLPATLTAEQWASIRLHFYNRCAYCGSNTTLVQEHFIPVKKGGEYTHNNILPACNRCNSSKQDKCFHEWYPKQTFYSKRRERKICSFLHYDNGIQQLSLA
jgi:hypothetical protein